MFNFFYRYDTFESTKVRRSSKARVCCIFIMLFVVYLLTAIVMALTLSKGNFLTDRFTQNEISVAFGFAYFACFMAIFWCAFQILKDHDDKH
jgi:putative exporter of polyketide antibiotics